MRGKKLQKLQCLEFSSIGVSIFLYLQKTPLFLFLSIFQDIVLKINLILLEKLLLVSFLIFISLCDYVV